MRKIFFLSIFISFFGCINEDNPEGVKYFAPIHLTQLDLTNIDNFWSEGIAIDTSYYMGANFENHTRFIEGIRLYSGNGKAIWISVINGNPDEFDNQWWYSECGDYIIFENQYNTIVEIDFSSNATFDLIKGILLNIAEEINERIDRFSYYVK